VILTGYIDRVDIGFVYKMADCLVLPSFCEGFGFPAVEAFACGVPVAASCVGILQEINKNSYTNLEPDNPEQIAKSINRLLTDYKLRELQIKTGLTEVQKFNWSDSATKTLALYRMV
jgi:glycosyltransferase involved in cell wall biosynthesis